MRCQCMPGVRWVGAGWQRQIAPMKSLQRLFDCRIHWCVCVFFPHHSNSDSAVPKDFHNFFCFPGINPAASLLFPVPMVSDLSGNAEPDGTK
jgi:hypothetical protein